MLVSLRDAQGQDGRRDAQDNRDLKPEGDKATRSGSREARDQRPAAGSLAAPAQVCHNVPQATGHPASCSWAASRQPARRYHSSDGRVFMAMAIEGSSRASGCNCANAAAWA